MKSHENDTTDAKDPIDTKEQTVESTPEQDIPVDITRITKVNPAEQAIGLKRAIDNPNRLEPTRYGDWEKNGRCIDF